MAIMFEKLKLQFNKLKLQIANKFVSEPEESEEIPEVKLDGILSDRFGELYIELNKLGKSQLRSNTLADIDRKQINKNLLHLLEIHRDQKGRPDLGFIKDLLEVADSLEEAVRAAENACPKPAKDQTYDSISNWLSGIRITQKRIMKLFERWDIRPIDSVGKPFDPVLHVSVDVKRTSDLPENTVVEEQRRGYLLGNEIIRYAEVVVAKPPSMVEFLAPLDEQDADREGGVSENTLSSNEVKDTNKKSSPQGFILWSNDDFID